MLRPLKTKWAQIGMCNDINDCSCN